MDLELSGKRALVTGSTAGIGAAIARQLASEDVTVVIHGRDSQRGRGLAAELTGAGRRAIFIGADLARPADITRLASQAREAALAGSGVTVNAIAAGLIRTPEVVKWFHSEAKARGWSDRWDEIEADILKSYLFIPVGRLGTADDVARVAVFLARKPSSSTGPSYESTVEVTAGRAEDNTGAVKPR